VNSLQLLTPAIERMEQYPVDPSQWRRRGGGVFGVRPWRSSAQPERLLASGRWALRHPS